MSYSSCFFQSDFLLQKFWLFLRNSVIKGQNFLRLQTFNLVIFDFFSEFLTFFVIISDKMKDLGVLDEDFWEILTLFSEFLRNWLVLKNSDFWKQNFWLRNWSFLMFVSEFLVFFSEYLRNTQFSTTIEFLWKYLRISYIFLEILTFFLKTSQLFLCPLVWVGQVWAVT